MVRPRFVATLVLILTLGVTVWWVAFDPIGGCDDAITAARWRPTPGSFYMGERESGCRDAAVRRLVSTASGLVVLLVGGWLAVRQVERSMRSSRGDVGVAEHPPF